MFSVFKAKTSQSLSRQKTPLRQKPLSIKDIPGPKGQWFIGDVVNYEQDPIAWIIRTKGQYGDIVKMDNETVIINDPALISRVLDETNGEFVLDNTADSRKSDEWREASFQKWMQSRKHMAKGLNRKFLNSHIQRTENCLMREADKLAGNEVDLFDSSQRLLGRAIADYCIGSDVRFDEICQAVEKVFWSSLEFIEPDESDTLKSRKALMKKAKELDDELLSLLTEVVNKRIDEFDVQQPNLDILDQLIEASDKVDAGQLVRAIRLMMISSHGPSGATFSWTLLRLVEDPKLLELVTEELSLGQNKMLTPGAFPMSFALLKEVMRLHPATWIMGRMTANDVYLGDYLIPENSKVIFSPYVTHRDQRFWQQPDEFLPERWLQEAKPHTKGAYYPFGAGPRVCPGTMLGPIQLLLGLKAIVTRHDIQLPRLEEVRPKKSTLLRPDNVMLFLQEKAMQ